MLTADLVMARRRSGKLFVPPLGEALRAEALALAETFLRFARAHVGRTRESLLETCRQIVVGPREKKLAQGLLKLVLDRCDFREETTLDPVAVRKALFEAAAAARRQENPVPGGTLRGRLSSHEALRAAVVDETAVRFGVDAATLEQALYADLPAAHVLAEAPPLSAPGLVDGYEMAQWQAVLLRAVKVRAQVHCASPEALRALFRKLKFLGLLHSTATVEGPRGRVEHAIVLDGPFSLFESVTRYGLALGLALPAIAACDAWSLEADLRWGAAREPVSFALAGKKATKARAASGAPEAPLARAALRDEVQQLLERLRDHDQAWEAHVAEDVLDLPGLGVCVPDLALRHRPSGKRVLLEVMGFWSREAVFKRLDLVRGGLATPLVFAASKHLRVSEALLDDVEHAALYVYARVMDASAILARAAAVAGLPKR